MIFIQYMAFNGTARSYNFETRYKLLYSTFNLLGKCKYA